MSTQNIFFFLENYDGKNTLLDPFLLCLSILSICLFEFFFNDMSTLVGHFVLPPRQRQKRYRRVVDDKKEEKRYMRKNKQNQNKYFHVLLPPPAASTTAP